MHRIPRFTFCLSLGLLIGLLLTFLNVQNLRHVISQLAANNGEFSRELFDYAVKSGSQFKLNHYQDVSSAQYRRGKALVYGQMLESGYLDHVFDIFARLGYDNATSLTDWDILWSHGFPFNDDGTFQLAKSLRPSQLVNHIPASGYYTSKVFLATSKLPGIPPAFRLPEQKDEFLAFVAANPKKFWIQKNNEHRGIQIKKFEDVELDKLGTFVQEYISNPLLIDNRKFDIGVYTVITEINPLTVYIFDGEVLVRFCPKEYHPFDQNDIDKYVIGDDYTPIWEMPSMEKYYNRAKLTRKQSLNTYVKKELGQDPNKIWQQVSEIIRTVLSAKKRDYFMQVMNTLHHSRNFFELSRFDFVIDENLKVFLMEANMSPNLSSAHFSGNRIMYEQVIFNLMSLVGLANAIYEADGKSRDEQNMMVSDRDISVFPEVCASECSSCSTLLCKMCGDCITEENRGILKKAYLGHVNRHAMRRIVPEPKAVPKEPPFDYEKSAFDEDKLLALWFDGKCIQDSSWCS